MSLTSLGIISFIPASFIGSRIYEACNGHLLYDSLPQYLSGVVASWPLVAIVNIVKVLQMEFQKACFKYV